MSVRERVRERVSECERVRERDRERERDNYPGFVYRGSRPQANTQYPEAPSQVSVDLSEIWLTGGEAIRLDEGKPSKRRDD